MRKWRSLEAGFLFGCERDDSVHHGLDVVGCPVSGDAHIGSLRCCAWGIILGRHAEVEEIITTDVLYQAVHGGDGVHGGTGGYRLLQDGVTGKCYQLHKGEAAVHFLEGLLYHQGLAVDAVIVRIHVADTHEIHGGFSIHLVEALCKGRQSGEGAVDRFIKADIHAADLVDKEGEVGEVYKAEMVNGDIKVVGDGLRQHFYAGAAPGEVLPIAVGGVDATVSNPVFSQPGYGQPEITRDGEYDDLWLDEVHADQADQVGLGVFIHT